MNFDPTISIGAIGQIVALIGTLLVFVFGVVRRVDVVGAKVDIMAQELTGLKDVVAIQAVQTNRLNRLEEDMRELRHGEGFVLPLRGKGL